MATAIPLISSSVIMATNNATPSCECFRLLCVFFMVLSLLTRAYPVRKSMQLHQA